METKEVTLSVRLEGQEVDNLEEGKEKSGIRTNAEFIRFLIKLYTNKSFVPPSMRGAE